jgi:hypothetical protein
MSPTTHITHIGTVILPVDDQDGNRFRIVERA